MIENTINRSCFCCEDREGISLPLGHWSIAGVGELDITIRICKSCGAVLQDPSPKLEVINNQYKNYSYYTNASKYGSPDNATFENARRQVACIKASKPGRSFVVSRATGSL